jgi:hypothetical protein
VYRRAEEHGADVEALRRALASADPRAALRQLGYATPKFVRRKPLVLRFAVRGREAPARGLAVGGEEQSELVLPAVRCLRLSELDDWKPAADSAMETRVFEHRHARIERERRDAPEPAVLVAERRQRNRVIVGVLVLVILLVVLVLITHRAR